MGATTHPRRACKRQLSEGLRPLFGKNMLAIEMSLSLLSQTRLRAAIARRHFDG
jgi:hypothetical protein